ncbi:MULTISPECIES: GNAT family N-acetyltransferase [Halorussus]|uniref:GNAT family N-acetyltransferase n=1 Tax=Halorussus TaxID=1070314 RepID=UPI00209EF20E|nr:GNAT family N-acetyltransferase [Halorussus vallis]USZ75318.1 GNAT family N-acetyltransferase [Halorussus vallis]
MGTREAELDGVQIREAEPDDVDGLREVARRSLHASYDDVLNDDVIEQAVENWYADDQMDDELAEEDVLYLVAEAGDEVVGFSQSLVLPDDPAGTILWLHVDPNNRDQGLGSTLLKRTQSALSEAGVERISANVLAGNKHGNRFYQDNGFEKVSDREAEIGGERYTENVYALAGERQFESREYEGETLYVNWAESERGSKAPFFASYTDDAGDDLYGWFCANCESFDTAMDSMERLKCNDCGNQKKPVRWDASYL